MTDFRALCAELVEKLDELNCHYNVPSQSAMIERALAALADEPAVPTVMEIVELADEIEAAGLGQVDLVRAALARWGNPAPQPVPVSELSPVAQAVLDSTMGLAATVREAQAVAAAALRAAADQLPLQPLTRDPADPFEQGLRQGQELSRAELLGIAAELEAT